MKDYVYVIEFGANLVKVGKSVNPEARAKNVASAAGRKPMRQWVSRPLMEARTAERLSHEALSRYRGHGEWFNCSFDYAAQVAGECITEGMAWTAEGAARIEIDQRERFNALYAALNIGPGSAVDFEAAWIDSFKREMLERAIKNYMVFLEIDSRREEVFLNAWASESRSPPESDEMPDELREELLFLRAMASEAYIRSCMVAGAYMGHVTEDCMLIAQDVSKIPEMVDLVESLAKQRLADGEKAPL